MRLNRTLALLVALVTLTPWGYFIYFMASVMPSFATIPNAGQPPDDFFQHFQVIWRLQILMMLFMVALMIFYVVHLFRSDRVPADKKALWAVVLFLGNLLAMPFYWYFYIWPRDDKGAA